MVSHTTSSLSQSVPVRQMPRVERERELVGSETKGERRTVLYRYVRTYSSSYSSERKEEDEREVSNRIRCCIISSKEQQEVLMLERCIGSETQRPSERLGRIEQATYKIFEARRRVLSHLL